MFKLVRIDTEEPSEIQLPSGTYLIGRDKLIGFDDKRLSHNQGIIIVKEDSVTIESSQRKIYLTKKGLKEKEILNKTYKTTLEFGDQFGFLESSYWYELQINEPSHRPLKEINVNTSDSVESHFTKESVVPKSPFDDEKPRKRKNGELEKKNRKSKRRKEESEEESDEQLSPEFESDEWNEEEKSKPVLERERCKYGAECYSLRTLRSNPAHKAHTAKYSHPRDEDWGDDGALKKCPQGANCRRRDPKHARKFKHPPGYRIPQPASSDSDSDSSQEYRSYLVLRTKRERKPPPKEDLEVDLEGSESEEDPFASDGSEDWMPDPYKL